MNRINQMTQLKVIQNNRFYLSLLSFLKRKEVIWNFMKFYFC